MFGAHLNTAPSLTKLMPVLVTFMVFTFGRTVSAGTWDVPGEFPNIQAVVDTVTKNATDTVIRKDSSTGNTARAVDDTREELPKHAFLPVATFNKDAIFLGLAYGYSFGPEKEFGILGSIYFRTNKRTTLDQIRPGFFVQRTEKERTFLLLELERIFLFLTHTSQHRLMYLGFYSGAGLGYTSADFSGTTATPEEGLTPVFNAGFVFKGKVPNGAYSSLFTSVWSIVRIGYQYSNVRSGARNRLYAALGIGF